MARVWKVDENWEHIQSSREKLAKHPAQSQVCDEIAYIPITDRVKMQVCVIRSRDKYGIYTLDHTSGFGGPGTWCSPTKEPFPYDEIKYCVNPFCYPNVPGLFSFRIADKWGIIEVVDGEDETQEKYDAVFGLTKRRVIVPCKFSSLEEADAQLGTPHEWREPVPGEEFE